MMSYSILNLSYDFTIEQLFAKNKQETEQYFEFQKEFSREDNVFLLVSFIILKYREIIIIIHFFFLCFFLIASPDLKSLLYEELLLPLSFLGGSKD